MKVTTNFGSLLRLARELYNAEKSGDLAQIEKARQAHDEYKKLCLEADEMSIGHTIGSLHKLGSR